MGAGGDQDLAHQLKRDWRKADLGDKHRALLAFVEKLTVNPGGITREDMEAVRAVGYSEQDYYAIVLLAARFNFITRVADAFGVELDEALTGALASMGEEQVFTPKG